MAKDPLKEMQRLADMVGDGKITVAEYEQRKAALFDDEVPTPIVSAPADQALSQTSTTPKRVLVIALAVAVAIVGIGIAMFLVVEGETVEEAVFIPDPPMEYGSDETLDLLYDGCAAGASSDCDMLYYSSPLDSEYETFSLGCGGRTQPREPTQATCMTEESAEHELDSVRVQCAEGFYAACDLMYYISPIGSDDEAFGATCGGLLDLDDTAVVDPEASSTCLNSYGYGSR